jgi:hypothetical protein
MAGIPWVAGSGQAGLRGRVFGAAQAVLLIARASVNEF